MRLMATRLSRYLIVACCCIALIACGSTSRKSSGNRYSIKQDHGPAATMDASKIKDAVPRNDPIVRAGNKNPYTVLGKTYHLVSTNKGYKERGKASWYGKKFHGHKTSNGEVYNMYGMTAAHKTLRIPSYVKVTNLDNKRSTIVRVNDRGPFHPGRIIDLSYAAATKLGFVGNGVANVEVEAIDVGTYRRAEPAKANPTKTPPPKVTQPWLVLGLFSDYDDAHMLTFNLGEIIEQQVMIDRVGSQYRVKIGPLVNDDEADTINTLLLFSDIKQGQIVHE